MKPIPLIKTKTKALITPLVALLLIEVVSLECDVTRTFGSGNNAVDCVADGATVPATWMWSVYTSWNTASSSSYTSAIGWFSGSGSTSTSGSGGSSVTGSTAITITCSSVSQQIGSATGNYAKRDDGSDCANGKASAPPGSGVSSQTQQCGETGATQVTPAE